MTWGAATSTPALTPLGRGALFTSLKIGLKTFLLAQEKQTTLWWCKPRAKRLESSKCKENRVLPVVGTPPRARRGRSQDVRSASPDKTLTHAILSGQIGRQADRQARLPTVHHHFHLQTLRHVFRQPKLSLSSPFHPQVTKMKRRSFKHRPGSMVIRLRRHA